MVIVRVVVGAYWSVEITRGQRTLCVGRVCCRNVCAYSIKQALAGGNEHVWLCSHTIFTPESIQLGPIQQSHVPQNRLTGAVELESIMWWVDIVSVRVGPKLQECTWCLTTEAVVVGHDTKERKCLWNMSWPETRVVADVRDS